MTLTAADVAQIMRVIEQSTFDELKLEMDGVKLHLRRTGATGEFAHSVTPRAEGAHLDAAIAGSTSGSAAAVAPHADASAAAAAAASPAVPTASAADENLRDVTSPMLGTFYRSPKPGSAPFVEVGSIVDVETIIAIIEVMKLMNTVRAGVRGIVTEILPADEALVEFGDVLMRVRADA